MAVPPRKRQAETASGAEPVAKRRSARQAQKTSASTSEATAPAPESSRVESPKASKASAKEGKAAKRVGGGGDDASRRVAGLKATGVKSEPKAVKVKSESKVAEVKSEPKTTAAKSGGRKTAKAKAMTPKPPAPAVSAGKVKEEEEKGVARDGSADPDFDSIPTQSEQAERHKGEWYWLMKAEPETRLENGIDVRFSIDDLRAKEQPEPWDGIRSYAARNNLRAMNAGDKSFFYHSNCKEPGIVGIMEVVKEFSEDTTARRPGMPYYDPSSTKEKPKWGLVHVRFVKKFAVPIFLKELRELGQRGDGLENMQMLKQSRLSVSRVGAGEWEYLCKVADKKAEEAGLAHEED